MKNSKQPNRVKRIQKGRFFSEALRIFPFSDASLSAIGDTLMFEPKPARYKGAEDAKQACTTELTVDLRCLCRHAVFGGALHYDQTTPF